MALRRGLWPELVLVALKALEALALTNCSTGYPKLTEVPFNNAYRYMDWLMTVPLLSPIFLVMKLSGEEFSSKAWTLGLGSAWLIVSGYF